MGRRSRGASCCGGSICSGRSMPSDYRIVVDISDLLAVRDQIAQQGFANVRKAVETMAEEAVERWRAAIKEARLWEGEKAPYIESIRSAMTGPLAAEVWSDYRLASEIEEGRPARDLKEVLPTAKKARRSKDGSLYLIIPFRHDTPKALGHPMPAAIYAQAKRLEKSRDIGMRMRKSATKHWLQERIVDWAPQNGRLPEGLAPKMRPHHKTDIYAGMVRMDTSSGKSKSSAYLTFRTMSQKSSGWVVGPRPGLKLAQGVADALGPVFQDAVRQGMAFDAGVG